LYNLVYCVPGSFAPYITTNKKKGKKERKKERKKKTKKEEKPHNHRYGHALLSINRTLLL